MPGYFPDWSTKVHFQVDNLTQKLKMVLTTEMHDDIVLDSISNLLSR